MGLVNTAGRHPSTVAIAQHFTYEHLPPHLAEVSRECCELAGVMIEALSDGPELTTGLRKLLEAKDCFVRSAVESGVYGAGASETGR